MYRHGFVVVLRLPFKNKDYAVRILKLFFPLNFMDMSSYFKDYL